MSTRVVTGLAPAGQPHPAIKLCAMVVLLVVVGLGLPGSVLAGQPSVQPPTGSQSGGVFIGPYTFATYISCTSGPSYNNSYSNALEGTHTFTFQGAPDGSLLVRIDGGGEQLLNSCGDPFTGSPVTVATYTVTYSSSGPPTPTPTPPTPTPAPGGAPPSSTGGGGAGSSKPTRSPAPIRTTPTPGVTTPTPTLTPTPLSTASPTPSLTPIGGTRSEPGGGSYPSTTSNNSWIGLLMWFIWLGLGLTLAALAYTVARSPQLRGWLADQWLRARLGLQPHVLRLKLALRRLGHGLAHNEPKRRGLSPHHHTGRLLAHHHTSYPALAFLVLVSTVLLAAYAISSHAANTQLSLTVLGPPPTVAATIDEPLDGDTFSNATVTVRGTCPTGLMVEIYRNTSFAGSVFCDASGLYNILITLIPGSNDLIARDVDGLGQYGPDSNTVTVTYIPPPPTPTPSPAPSTPTPAAAPRSGTPLQPATTPRPGSAAQPTESFLLETTQPSYPGAQVGQELRWPVTVRGGRAPYTIEWNWNDGVTDKLTLDQAGLQEFRHTYHQAGIYRVIVRARDAQGREAALSLAVVVTGEGAASIAGGPSRADEVLISGLLGIAWPLLAGVSLIVLCFWLGEHHKQALQRYTNDTISPQQPLTGS